MGSWHFDEGSGTIAIGSSGNGNDGTIHGATRTTGKLGSKDYVDISDSDGDLKFGRTDNFSVCAWINMASYNPSWSEIVGDDGNAEGYRQWSISIDP